MTIAASNIRNLIPFAGGNWDALVNNPIFSALVAEAPEFWGLSEGEFKILDFIDENVICDPDDENAWFWKLIEQRNKEYIEWETKGKWEQ